jgi:nucleolar protein 56
MGVLYLLYESASGFALFERVKSEEIDGSATSLDVADLKKFSNMVKLKSFLPFTSAEQALENINSVSEGEPTKSLLDWLELNIPKKDKVTLGLIEPKLGNALSELCQYKCKSNDLVLELMRGIRVHFSRFLTALKPGDLQQAQLGLSHSYSRSKVKFNVHRVDNMIIQSSALLDQLDKDLNTFSMRVREWYGWHFPELIHIIQDNTLYAKCAKFIKNKSTLKEDMIKQLEEITEDSDKAKQIYESSRISMGQDISPVDLVNIEQFATRVIMLSDYRKQLYQYLSEKMNLCAPNLTALIGKFYSLYFSLCFLCFLALTNEFKTKIHEKVFLYFIDSYNYTQISEQYSLLFFILYSLLFFCF